MLPFKNKILFVGYGAVAECTLPILFKHIKVPAKNVTVMDFEDRRAKLAPWIKKGVRFVRDRVTEQNMTKLLAKHVGPGDILIDLAWNIDACEILQWCHDHGVRYINTSTELWGPLLERPQRASDHEDALLAPHEPAPDAEEVEKQGPDRRHRAWRQPRPHFPFRQAGPDRHRHQAHQGQEGQGCARREDHQADQGPFIQPPRAGTRGEGSSTVRSATRRSRTSPSRWTSL